MTTIAFDGRYLAVDSQVSQGDTRLSALKLFDRVDRDGVRFVAAGCGDWGAVVAAVEALEDLRKPRKGDYNLAVWRKDRQLEEVCGAGGSVPISYTPWADGSGAQAALGALHMGASAEEAVSIAAMVDVWTGGPVSVLDTTTGRITSSLKRRSRAPR